MKSKLRIFSIICLMSLPLVASAASIIGLIPCTKANSPEDPSQKVPNGLNCNSWNDLIGVIQFLINNALIVATFLATISFAWAGWLYLTSNGDTGQVQKAHKIFTKVIQGFIFMGLAYLLVRTILVTIAKPDYSKLQ